MNQIRSARLIPSCALRYAAAADGSIYSLVSGAPRRMKPSLCGDGYLRVNVGCVDGKRRMRAVHRLVAEVFHENPENKPLVNHKNGNKADCSEGNLEWATHKENMDHAVATGLHKPCGSRDAVKVSVARSMRAQGVGLAAIALAIGMGITTAHEYTKDLHA